MRTNLSEYEPAFEGIDRQRAVQRLLAHTRLGDDCWECESSRDGRYGEVWAAGKARRAHRVSWRCYRGDIPKGIYVLHSCDNQRCWKPSHLFLGTHSDNMIDSMQKGRSVPAAQRCKMPSGENHWNYKHGRYVGK